MQQNSILHTTCHYERHISCTSPVCSTQPLENSLFISPLLGVMPHRTQQRYTVRHVQRSECSSVLAKGFRQNKTKQKKTLLLLAHS